MLAITSLKYSIIEGSKNQGYIGLTKNDVAYDCIADLFHKNEEGRFIKLDAYFSSFNIEEMSNQEIINNTTPKIGVRMVLTENEEAVAAGNAVWPVCPG